MTRLFKPCDRAEERRFLDAHCHRCTRFVDQACPILDTARRTDPFDDGYPAEWIVEDGGAPCCTAFDPVFAAPVAEPVPAPAAPAPAPAATPAATPAADASTRVLRDALKRRPDRTSWTVPYADVATLFDGSHLTGLCEASSLGRPERARVRHLRGGITVTARSARGDTSVSAKIHIAFEGRP